MASGCCGRGGSAYRLILSLDGQEFDLGIRTDKMERELRRLGPKWAGPKGVYSIEIETGGVREPHGEFAVMDSGEYKYTPA